MCMCVSNETLMTSKCMYSGADSFTMQACMRDMAGVLCGSLQEAQSTILPLVAQLAGQEVESDSDKEDVGGMASCKACVACFARCIPGAASALAWAARILF